MIKNLKTALIFRLAATVVAITGFLSMMGVFSGEWHSGALMFYTLQSNVLIIALFIMLTIRTIIGIRDTESNTNTGAGYFPRFEMVCVINIMLTFLVYWVMLAPMLFTMVDEFPMWTYANLAVHGFTPVLCLLDYILFTRRGRLKYRDVYYVCIFPLLYLIGTSIAGLMGYVFFTSAEDGLPIRFPYFFYDFDRIGLLALVYILALFVFLLMVGHVFYFVDRRKARRKK